MMTDTEWKTFLNESDTEWKTFLNESEQAMQGSLAKSRHHSDIQKRTWRKIKREIAQGKRAPLERSR